MSNSNQLTENEIATMRHAVGFHHNIRYRNHYAAGPDDIRMWNGLCKRDLAYRQQKGSLFPYPYYGLTHAGLKALGDNRETLVSP